MQARLILSELNEHPLRKRLNSEFHARPPLPLEAGVLVTHLVFKHDGNPARAEPDNLSLLCNGHVCNTIESSGSHLMIETGAFRLRWELHTEFSSYTFYRHLKAGEIVSPDSTAFDAVHPDWLKAIAGKLIVAMQIEVRPCSEVTPASVVERLSPAGKMTVAAQISDRSAYVFTDFRIDNGMCRFLLLNEKMTPLQLGRAVQRLVEIETYRMMALLGLPAAQEIGRWLYSGERQLSDLMDRIGQTRSAEDERDMLGTLSTLAAEVERSVARTTFRFGASRAYNGLVESRIAELREERLPGLPTFGEFMQRRLRPAMNTCEAVSRRLNELSERVARTSGLLRARVDVELERQNHEMLADLNRRGRLQLRLQETVEGLSIVVLTSYASQLVLYMARGTQGMHNLSPEVVTAISIPVIAISVALATRRMRKRLAAEVRASRKPRNAEAPKV